MSLEFIPFVTTASGSVLTAENWHAVGVRTLACYLKDLLIKPGFETLQQFGTLASYFGWSQKMLLHAGDLPMPNEDKLYSFRSPYDGKLIAHTVQDIFDLIPTLKPDVLIRPDPQSGESESVSYKLSDQPAQDACEGIVYTWQGHVSLMAPAMRNCFELLDAQCACPVCAQGFTRAYLHHLYEQTPLLCKRYLVQHNVFLFSAFTRTINPAMM